MSYSNNIYREIILDHTTNPRNKNKKHDNYKETVLKNPSCGDVVTIYVKKRGRFIEDITYDVFGCSICNASISIMTELLIGKTVAEAQYIIDNFNKMVMNEPFDEMILGDAISLKGVAVIPARIKCATLPYKAFMEAASIAGGDKIEQ